MQRELFLELGMPQWSKPKRNSSSLGALLFQLGKTSTVSINTHTVYSADASENNKVRKRKREGVFGIGWLGKARHMRKPALWV